MTKKTKYQCSCCKQYMEIYESFMINRTGKIICDNCQTGRICRNADIRDNKLYGKGWKKRTLEEQKEFLKKRKNA